MKINKNSLSLKCPYHLKVPHVAAGRLRHSFCLWRVIGPPRKGAGGFLGFGWTGGGGDCRPIGCWETTGDSREPPEPLGAEWVPVLSRQACVAPSCHKPPPHRREERQEVRPPSGPAGPRSGGCWETQYYCRCIVQARWIMKYRIIKITFCQHVSLTCVIDRGRGGTWRPGRRWWWAGRWTRPPPSWPCWASSRSLCC